MAHGKRKLTCYRCLWKAQLVVKTVQCNNDDAFVPDLQACPLLVCLYAGKAVLTGGCGGIFTLINEIGFNPQFHTKNIKKSATQLPTCKSPKQHTHQPENVVKATFLKPPSCHLIHENPLPVARRTQWKNHRRHQKILARHFKNSLSAEAQRADILLGWNTWLTDRNLKESEVCTIQNQRCGDSRWGTSEASIDDIVLVSTSVTS